MWIGPEDYKPLSDAMELAEIGPLLGASEIVQPRRDSSYESMMHSARERAAAANAKLTEIACYCRACVAMDEPVDANRILDTIEGRE